jgi:hypothetical protein
MSTKALKESLKKGIETGSDILETVSVPFVIVRGHRSGVVSSVLIDPTHGVMLSASGNRGWDCGGSTTHCLFHEFTPIYPSVS